MFEIKYEDKQLKQLQRTLAGIPRALPKVMSRGLNRTATEARTKVVRLLASRTKLKQKDVRASTIMQKATYANWRAAVQISRKRIPIMRFGARQTKKGVTYKKSGSRALIPHAFIATMASGHKGVFARKFSSRLPIIEQRGPSLGQVFSGAQDEANRIQVESLARLQKNIDDQVKLILRRRAG